MSAIRFIEFFEFIFWYIRPITPQRISLIELSDQPFRHENIIQKTIGL